MLILYLTIVVLVHAARETPGCGNCEKRICPLRLNECPASDVVDLCGCCPAGICGKLENQRCYLEKYGDKHNGLCGSNMECQETEEPENGFGKCVCNDLRMVCASNRTFNTICEMSQKLMENQQVTLSHFGPCEAPPVFIKTPKVLSINKNSDVFMDCQVYGFPIPAISWGFMGSGARKLRILPDTDLRVKLELRGMKKKLHLLSTLVIQNVRESDTNGSYFCMAENKFGKVETKINLAIKIQKKNKLVHLE